MALADDGRVTAANAVIARSEATKQSSLRFVASLDCFAPLAMTEDGG
jgi:hypothetical protein